MFQKHSLWCTQNEEWIISNTIFVVLFLNLSAKRFIFWKQTEMCKSSGFWRENSNYQKTQGVQTSFEPHFRPLLCYFGTIFRPLFGHYYPELVGSPCRVDILSSLRSQKQCTNTIVGDKLFCGLCTRLSIVYKKQQG